MSGVNGRREPAGFRHEALPYAGPEDLARRVEPLIRRAVEAGDPVLVAVDAVRIALLRDRLGAAAEAVTWRDIRGIGGNPARIIPLWREFVARHPSGRLLGFGEPVWPGRTGAELAEAQRHEELLNLAFAGAAAFTLLCPYDTEGLAAEVVRATGRSHPATAGEDGAPHANPEYPGPDELATAFDAALPEPARPSAGLALAGGASGAAGAAAHRFVAEEAERAGLTAAPAERLSLAAAAVAAGMARPEGTARLRVWREPPALVAEIEGLAPVRDPLAGREWPPPTGGTRGLWLANQLCDLVELRRPAAGAVVRMRVAG